MNLKTSTVSKIFVDEIYSSHGLDPISIYLEDYEIGKGKITISCYDKSWHSFWGAMGEMSISDFFLSCDNGYIVKNLSSTRSTINDCQSLEKQIKKFYGDDWFYDIPTMKNPKYEHLCKIIDLVKKALIAHKNIRSNL